MKKWLVFLLLGAGIWFWQHEPAAKWRGIPAAHDPVQSATNLPPAFQHGDYKITPLARYEVKAVVLARERYRNDPAAPLAPVDLALGWGSMSTAAVINDLSISQSGRWYEYTWSGDAPLAPDEIAAHSANTHCLPATPEVRRQLLAIKRHDVVTLEGFLVEVTTADGFRWRSSLSRTDTGGGACEVMWITAIHRTRL
jgi:hypothetical protein